MAETKGTITCRLCGTPIPVEFTRAEGNGVKLTVADAQPLADHYAKCQGMATDGKALEPARLSITDTERVGRVDRLLTIVEQAGHLTRGTRACTMCGTANEECLEGLKPRRTILGKWIGRKPCCNSCGIGNTHPTGKEAESCAEWGRANGAQA